MTKYTDGEVYTIGFRVDGTEANFKVVFASDDDPTNLERATIEVHLVLPIQRDEPLGAMQARAIAAASDQIRTLNRALG